MRVIVGGCVKSIIDQLEDLDKKATPGPWQVPADALHLIQTSNGKKFWEEDVVINDDEASQKDKDLIVFCRNSLPLFLELYRAAQNLEIDSVWHRDCVMIDIPNWNRFEEALRKLEGNE